MKLTKNADPDKYRYSGIVLDLMHVHNLYYQMVAGVKCHYLGDDNSSSVHVDNRKKNIFVLG